MRRIVGYVEGRAVWSDNIPSTCVTFRLTGESSGVDQDRTTSMPTDEMNTKSRAKRLTANQAKLDARPVENGRPRLSEDVGLIGRGKRPGYATEEERIAARRKTWREYSKRRRAA